MGWHSHNNGLPPPTINTLNCLILQSKTSLKEIPPRIMHYFVNSKRRFFVYFKSHQQMIQTMHILTANHVKFYPRGSLLPDRQEQEQHVYHCNFKYKKQDLRKNLHRDTPYNQPRLLFDRYPGIRGQPSVRQAQEQEERGLRQQVYSEFQEEPKSHRDQDKRQQKGSNELSKEVRNILENKFLLKQIFLALNQSH